MAVHDSFSSTVNVIGTVPAQASCSVVPLPAITDVEEVDKEVALWGERVDEVLAKLRDRGVRDRHLLAALVPGARDGGEETKGSKVPTSIISPRSKPQLLIHNPPGASLVRHVADLDHEDPNPSNSNDQDLATNTLVDQARKRPSARCKDTPLGTGWRRSESDFPAVDRERLPSICPEERANDATRSVDEALKIIWQKRGREFFERLFYLKLDSANDKCGS
ncbi:hypothetical protein AC1031_011053 [Aphanomyces cochlioides]|nr:hypothetical protein AC1031_011053 [Aphanomyces cochlioides]